MNTLLARLAPLVSAASVILCTLASCGDLAAQGFDWLYDARRPFAVPLTYVGASARYGAGTASGSLTVGELWLECAEYTGSTSVDFSAGVAAEHWLLHNTALTAELGLARSRWRSSEPAPSLPLADGRTIVSEYVLEGSVWQVYLRAGAKRRLFWYVNAQAGADLGLMLSNTVSQKEQLLAPVDRTFANGQQSIDLGTASAGPSTLSLGVFTGISADLSLWRGVYLSPTLSLRYSLVGEQSAGSFRGITANAGVSVLFGL